MKQLKTRDLDVLKTYFLGGMVGYSGDTTPPVTDFTEYKNLLIIDGNYSRELVESVIDRYLDEHPVFTYYGDDYILKFPGTKNYSKLVDSVLSFLED